MGKREKSVMVRLDEDGWTSLETMAAETRIPPSTLAHNAVMALLDSYRENGFFTSPLRMVVEPHRPREVWLNEPPDPIPPMGANLGRAASPAAPEAPDLSRVTRAQLEAELRRRRKEPGDSGGP